MVKRFILSKKMDPTIDIFSLKVLIQNISCLFEVNAINKFKGIIASIEK
jgi:hypothetical protein